MRKPVVSQLIVTVVVAMTGIAGSAALFGQAATNVESQVDKVFDRWSMATPGCAVGVSVAGKPVLAKAYGMADLEHDVKNTAETIFEAGSVSKQFTAAAVLLLARDGKLSLDDPVKKHIPELPEYGHPLTIRHMLNHTSGLRDWGGVAGISGWPRTTRVHTHAHVLDIVSRQRSLNFPPGTRYSYSNTGYNLAAMIVSRVSGMPFADVTRQRIFEPLGMTRTSWRDDYTRIVKGRAIAYAGDNTGFRADMPFENAHGNGGLLTTVGDLLIWTQNFVTPKIGDPSFVQEQERPGKFNDGRAHGYALGLQIDQDKGLRRVAHSGSTAGYRAHLSHYPEPKVAVAVLCNTSSANATSYTNAVADLYLAGSLKTDAAAPPKQTIAPGEVQAAAGMYRHTNTGVPVTMIAVDGGLRMERGPVFLATSPTRFVTVEGDVFELGPQPGTARAIDSYGTADTYARVTRVTPTSEQLQDLTGVYRSEEAEVALTVAVEGSDLVIKRRPDTTIKLTPTYADAFTGELGSVIFRRDGGRVTAVSVSQGRVWDLRFTRQPPAPTSSPNHN